MVYLGFFWSRNFQLLLGVVVVSAFCFLILRRFIRLNLPQRILKIVYGIIFLPLVLLPAFKCCFKVPYIFCRACPSKCPWGISRTFIFGSFLTLNLFGRFWCFSMCPFGTCQEYQARASKKNFQLLHNPHILSYPVLVLTGWMYSLTLLGSSLVAYFEIGYYVLVGTTVLAATLIFTTAFFVPRFWCRYLCPVGAIAELLPFNLGK